MERNQFTWYRSYYEAMKTLPPEDFKAAVLAICDYALNEQLPNLDGVPSAIFTLVRPTLDTGRNKAASRQNKSEQLDNKPEQTKNKSEQLDNKPEQTKNKPEQTHNKSEQTGKEKEREKEKERDIENDSYIPPVVPPSGRTRPPRFTPPTLAEVQSYVAERHSSVDPQEFIDFYASKGWMVGKTPMKDWKAACRNAERWDRWSSKQQQNYHGSNVFMEMLREEEPHGT